MTLTSAHSLSRAGCGRTTIGMDASGSSPLVRTARIQRWTKQRLARAALEKSGAHVQQKRAVARQPDLPAERLSVG